MKRILTPLLVSGVVAGALATPSVANAQAPGFDPEFQVNTYTTGDQGYAAQQSSGVSVARRDDGSFVVIWAGDAPVASGSGVGVFGQRYDASGAADGTEFQINTYTTLDQGYHGVDVSSAADGSFVVVWSSEEQDGDGFGVFGQRYDASGSADGTEFQVNTYTTWDQGYKGAAVSSAADGRFVIVWGSQEQDGDLGGVFGQLFDASGVAAGTEFQVNTYTTNGQSTYNTPDVSAAPDGRFVVVWASQEQFDFSWDVIGQRFDSTGAPDGTEFQVNTYTTDNQGYHAVAASMGADGSFVVAWGGNGAGDYSGIFAQRFDATGAAAGTEFQVNTYTTGDAGTQNISASSAADGRFVIVWNDESDGSGATVVGRRYDSAGVPTSDPFQVNTYTTNAQGYGGLAVSSAADGSFVVAWSSDDIDGSHDAVVARVTCDDADGDGICDIVCAASPAPMCTGAGQAKLDVNEKKAGKEKLKLQWKKLADATVQGDFGDPVGGSTEVVLCIYDDADALVQGLQVARAGQQCAGKACWKAKGTKGYGYNDKDTSADGVAKISFGAGDPGKGKADGQAKNNSSKGQASLPTGIVANLTGNTSPTIQIVTSDGFCATATMNEVKKDDVTRYSAQLK